MDQTQQNKNFVFIFISIYLHVLVGLTAHVFDYLSLLLRIPQAVHPVATLANIEREGLLQKPLFAFPTSTRFDLQAF